MQCLFSAAMCLGIASILHRVVGFAASNDPQTEIARGSLAIPDSWVRMPGVPAITWHRQGRGATVSKGQDQIEESPNYILFPMAVGALFLAFLVVGALLG